MCEPGEEVGIEVPQTANEICKGAPNLSAAKTTEDSYTRTKGKGSQFIAYVKNINPSTRTERKGFQFILQLRTRP